VTVRVKVTSTPGVPLKGKVKVTVEGDDAIIDGTPDVTKTIVLTPKDNGRYLYVTLPRNDLEYLTINADYYRVSSRSPKVRDVAFHFDDFFETLANRQ
jgi:hypothetical protein